MRIKKQTYKRISTFLCVLLGAFIFAPMCSASGFTGITEVDNMFSKFFTLLFAVLKVGGVALLGYGIYTFAMSFQQHDPSARLNGILMMVGGGLLFFSQSILGFIGIEI